MSVCGQSGQTEDDSGSEEVTASAAAVRDIYKKKPASKVVRVLTVLAYLLSVSLAAILLSVYYVCVWKSPDLPPLNETELSAQRRQADHHDYVSSAAASSDLRYLSRNFSGGGDSGVNRTAVNITTVLVSAAETTDSSAEETTTDSTLLFYTLNGTDDNTTEIDIT